MSSITLQTMTTDHPSALPCAMRKNRRLFFALSFLAVVGAVLPLWLLPIDFMDGRRMDFAMSTGLFQGEHSRLFESRWQLEYFMFAGIKYLNKLSSIPYRVFYHVIATSAIAGIAIEVGLSALRVCRMQRPYALLAAFLAATYPTWAALANSDNLIRAVCVWFMLLGYRLVCSRKFPVQLAGVLFLLLSFQYNPNFLFVGGLAITDNLLEFIQRESLPLRAWHRTVALVVLPILLFAALTHYAKPYGLYEKYTQFSIAHGVLAYIPCLPVSIIIAVLCERLAALLRQRRFTARFIFLIPLMLCAGSTLRLYNTYGPMAERAAIEVAIIDSLKNNPDAEPTAGMVYLYYEDLNEIKIEPYEANWLMWKAYNKKPWLSQMGNTAPSQQGLDLPENIHDIMDNKNIDHAIDELLPKRINLHCQSIIVVKGMPYQTWMAWKWLTGLAPQPTLQSNLTVTRCG